jgi:LCP family protein required for cell wall assembly
MDEKQKKKKKVWQIVLIWSGAVVGLLLTLMLVAVLVVSLKVNHLLNQITPYDSALDATVSPSDAEDIIINDPENVVITPEEEEELPDISDIEFPTQPQEPEQNQSHVLNILLVGQDRRPGQGRQRSDSMILVTVNKATKSVTLTSFMRDSYVQIPGYQPNKMNAAYAFGGMKLLSETMQVNFGVEVDGCVEVDFNGFQKVVDLLGGVDIQLTAAEVKYMNHATNWGLQVGTNHLNGEQALVYSRIREIDSDYQRARRQRAVIMAIIDKYKSLPVLEMIDMLEDILPLVTTNMEKGDIIGYALDVGPMLASANYNTLRIPADGTFKGGIARVRPGLASWFQYDIDFAANRKLLEQIMAPTP